MKERIIPVLIVVGPVMLGIGLLMCGIALIVAETVKFPVPIGTLGWNEFVGVGDILAAIGLGIIIVVGCSLIKEERTSLLKDVREGTLAERIEALSQKHLEHKDIEDKEGVTTKP